MKNANKDNKNCKVKIIPLGGLEQIGMNMTAIEYEDSIIVMDCGLAFPSDDMLGIDLVIPDVTYLTQYKQELAMDVIADMKAAGLDVLVDCADCAYTDSRNPEFLQWMLNGYHFRLKELEDLRTLAEPIVKIAGCRMEGLGSRADGFKEKYGTKLKVTLAGEQWLDTMDPGVSKGAAVKLLQESLMIRPEETMVFGDQLNDIEMLNQAYYSFSVANGRPETRAAARFLADSNVNQGPLKILKLLVERK